MLYEGPTPLQVVLIMVSIGATACTLPMCGTGSFRSILEFKDYYIETTASIESFVTTPPSVVECMAACVYNLGCVSAFYNTLDGRCELHDVRFYSPQDGAFHAGWEYLIMTNGPVCPGDLGYIYRRDLRLCFSPRVQTLRRLGNARAECAADGGHLLVVDSQAKQDAVVKQLNITQLVQEQKSGQKGFYIDGKRVSRGVWKWVSTGELVSFEAWAPNEGPGSNVRVTMIMADAKEFKWASVIEYARPFICQIDVALVN